MYMVNTSFFLWNLSGMRGGVLQPSAFASASLRLLRLFAQLRLLQFGFGNPSMCVGHVGVWFRIQHPKCHIEAADGSHP